jgi:DNA polymerase II large subunit
MKTEDYFQMIDRNVKQSYLIAEEARKKGLDPVDKVEIPLALSLAEKVIGLISTKYPQLQNKKVIDRIIELEKQYGRLDTTVSFKIAEEIAKQNFCEFESMIEAIDAGIRVGFSYTTLGVVSSPIEGYTELKLNKTKDGKEYFVAYFSGPIRSAGTTASCIVLMIIDYLRECFGFAKYDPTEDEIKRYVTENYDYHERVTNLQYLPSEEEIIFLAKNLPIQISGDPTEKREVSNYKDLPRIETDFIRGGMCLIFSEGLAQKAQKGLRLLNSVQKNGVNATGFNFLEEFVEKFKKLKKAKIIGDSVPTYMKDLVAGRPMYGYPSASGAFRFRYGRCRNAGFSGFAIHPATMGITDDFIAIGTQLKIEKPTKGGITSVCDRIDGPIVRFKDGSVKMIRTLEEARACYQNVDEIIYFGDMLFPFSDLANRNYDLIKPGYVEEWWALELTEVKKEKFDPRRDYYNITFDDALRYSKEYKIPLHPNFIFYWTQIKPDQFFSLLEWIYYGQINQKLVLPYGKNDFKKFEKAKRALELLGVEHQVTLENVVISKKDSKSLFVNLGLEYEIFDKEPIMVSHFFSIDNFPKKENVLDIINETSRFEIKDKAGSFIGTRMGRPEKAKLRKLTGSPNVLFPVGYEGGRLRSVQESYNNGEVLSTFPLLYCNECDKESLYKKCIYCEKKCMNRYYSLDDRSIINEKSLTQGKTVGFSSRKMNIKPFYEDAIKKLSMKDNELPALIKGVRGMSSENHIIEHLEKGILRAKYGLQVNKDGTIRFDCTEMPLTHFKPKEISVSVERLRELGYEKDIYGEILNMDDQILELKPHDILLPCCPDSPDEKADDVFIRISRFIDSLLEKFYSMKPFFNVKKREDLVGHFAVCMAPHNCAGVIARIIGFSQVQGLLASPYMHAAMRRDCDGDEAAVMLLLDVLLNFSKEFLPSHRGGTQDAPLVLNGKINAGEVDDQILDFELVDHYPLELYKKAEQKLHSSEIHLYLVKDRLKENADPFIDINFTHNTSDMNKGVLCSSYKKLATMGEKVAHQMSLVEKIRAVDPAGVAKLMIERHFIRDIRGNLRKFSMQQFRCVSCNEKFRRPPLLGNCPRCKGKIIFTISEGSIKKYMDPALELVEKYEVSPYIKQSLELTERYIESIFGRELEKQEAIQKWF